MPPKPSQTGLQGVPEEWALLYQILEDCRHNFVAVPNPETEDEWKYLRNPEALSWGNNTREALLNFTDESNKIWVPDAKDGYIEGEIVERGEKTTKVIVRREEISVKTIDLQEPNPSAFDGCEDMAMLSFLDEASVLHNLKVRYRHNLIHTYSGLFCITVNPWRWLPIYSPKIILFYKGQTLNSMPPHIYAIADNVYNNMLEGDEDQSILITGESGAGKTENTKKIIQYFTIVAAQKYDRGQITLEEQICQSNPVLEAFGNAKSVHNDNSSRFGKFIAIWFNHQGKVTKATIDSYLLEKSRLTTQASNERSYHIFYQLLSSGTTAEMKGQLFLTGEPKDYRFLEKGMEHVENIDDAEEMNETERGLEILNFTPEERINMFKMTAACLLMGQIKFRSKHKDDDIVAVESIIEPDQVCTLLGIDTLSFIESLTEPTVVVRGEMVKQSRNLEQVVFSLQALAKAVYEKKFRWLVKKCNITMSYQHKKQKSWHFIGILDIAGFEIFDINSFEQLCINYTNEKLQYFFNHQMFVREQDEYRLEGLKWEMIDFALDLQPTIDLIEKPMGILSLLEEECIMPKGGDATFLDKVNEQHLQKHAAVFGKPKGSARAKSHFSINHYAGIVNYNVTGWMDKNKDPLNACVVALLKRSKNPLAKEIWTYYGTTGFKTDDMQQAVEDSKKKRRGSMAFMTVSTIFKEQLFNLISVLNASHPHFVRCVVPNYERRAGIINGPLVLNQLRCNGVLEGLRIVSRGFPNRLLYEDFRDRFRILSSARADWQQDGQTASQNICEDVGLVLQKDFDLGMTKLFFRVGVLGRLELLRTQKLNEVITELQAHVRSYLVRYKWKFIEMCKKYIVLIQRNVRYWINLRNWGWFKLVKMVQPAARHSTEFMRQLVADKDAELDYLRQKLAEALLQNERIRQDEDIKKRLEELEQQLKKEREEKKNVEQSGLENKKQLNNLQSELENQAALNKSKDDEIKRLKAALGKSQVDIDNKETITNDVIIIEIDSEAAKSLVQLGLLNGVNANKTNDKDSKELSRDDKGDKDIDSLSLKELKDMAAKYKQLIGEGGNDVSGGEEGGKRTLTDEELEKMMNKDINSLGLQDLRNMALHMKDSMKKKDDEISNLQSQLSDAKKSMEEYDKRMRQQEQELNQLRNERKQFEKEMEDLRNKLKDSDEALNAKNRLLAQQADEINRLKEIIRGLEQLVADLRSQLESTKRNLEDKERIINRQQDEINEFKNRLKKMEQKLNAEAEENRKRENELLKLQRHIAEMTHDKEAKQLVTNTELTELRRKLEALDKTLRSQNDQLREARLAYGKLTEENKRLQGRISELESHLNQSKTEQRRLEREVEDLRDEIARLLKKIEQLTKKLEILLQENAVKDKEISRLNNEIAKMIELHEEELSDLKERHHNILTQLQDKYDILHRKALRLESENQQMKAQIYNQPSGQVDTRRVSLTKTDSTSTLARIQEGMERVSGEHPAGLAGMRRSSYSRLSSGVDLVAVQLDDLERQKQELIDDKRMMRNEIDSLIRSLENSTEERQSLMNQMNQAQIEINRLKKRVTKESEEKQRFLQDVRQAQYELDQQKQRTIDLLMERGSKMDAERAHAVMMKTGASVETQQASSRLAGMEKLCKTLNEEVATYRKRLEDANNKITEMEKENMLASNEVSKGIASGD